MSQQEHLYDWPSHIESWEVSQMSQKEYCAHHNLPVHRFYYWRKKLSSWKRPKKKEKQSAKSIGRPLKYGKILRLLKDAGLYTPAIIASVAEEHGLIEGKSESEKHKNRTRLRVALSRFKNYHQFPKTGDGLVIQAGQCPMPGWSGWRWKSRLSESD